MCLAVMCLAVLLLFTVGDEMIEPPSVFPTLKREAASFWRELEGVIVKVFLASTDNNAIILLLFCLIKSL